MGEKIKFNSNFLLQLIKSAVLGVVVSVILVLIFAFVLKFVELGDTVISIANQLIKIISIFIATISLIKKSPYKILFKSCLLGAVYMLLTFILFSALRGEYHFTASTILDISIGAITGIIIAIILNVFKKEKFS